jgi:hypothetical protein
MSISSCEQTKFISASIVYVHYQYHHGMYACEQTKFISASIVYVHYQYHHGMYAFH